MMRGLQKDLEICNKATPGPWECWLSAVQSGWMVRVGRGEYCDSINTAYYPENKIRTEGYGCDNTFIADLNDDEYHTYSSLQEQIANAKFIAAAREGWPHAIERAIKAEAEVERLTDLLDHYNAKCAICDCADDVTILHTENAKLRKVVDAASELVTQINNRTKTMGLDMSNYHAISITVKPGDAGRDYWEAVWAFEQAIAELDKEGE